MSLAHGFTIDYREIPSAETVEMNSLTIDLCSDACDPGQHGMELVDCSGPIVQGEIDLTSSEYGPKADSSEHPLSGLRMWTNSRKEFEKDLLSIDPEEAKRPLSRQFGFRCAKPTAFFTSAAVHGAFFFALVLLSYALFLGGLLFTRFGDLFYRTASAVQSRAGGGQIRSGTRPNRRPSAGRLEKIVGALFWLKRDTRALVVKDLRMFWRDTTQWGQSVMLFGLLGVYIINLRNFTHQLTSPFWVNLVAFLNLGVCALNLASVTTRFVFPQFSLEGRRLWIVGLAPMGLARVVKIKFWLASALSLAVTCGLILLSCYLLKMSWDRVLFFGAVIGVMTFALNGLAVGLGVLYPNLQEANPNKIVSGFGGTLCFVLSSFYILAAVLLLLWGAAGWHARADWAVAGIAGFVLLSVAIGWLPLKLGLRQLKNFEA